MKILPLVLAMVIISATAVSQSHALSPRGHRATGGVQSNDLRALTLTIESSKDSKPVVFQWDGETTFWENKEPVNSSRIQAGSSVRVYYRVFPGRLEARDIFTITPKNRDHQ